MKTMHITFCLLILISITSITCAPGTIPEEDPIHGDDNDTTEVQLGGYLDLADLPSLVYAYIYAVNQNGTPLEIYSYEITVEESENQSDWEEVEFDFDEPSENQPINVALTLDYSGSMYFYEGVVEDMEEAAITFINLLNSPDAGEIVKFASYAEVVQAYTTDKNALIDSINSDWAGERGNTAFYDALFFAGQDTVQQDRPFGVLGLTDGYENNSTHSLDEVLSLYKENGIPIFTIGLSPDSDSYLLQFIADETGGFYYYSPDSADLQQIYIQISGIFDKTYNLSWEPTKNLLASTTYVRISIEYHCSNGTYEDELILQYSQ